MSSARILMRMGAALLTTFFLGACNDAEPAASSTVPTTRADPIAEAGQSTTSMDSAQDGDEQTGQHLLDRRDPVPNVDLIEAQLALSITAGGGSFCPDVEGPQIVVDVPQGGRGVPVGWSIQICAVGFALNEMLDLRIEGPAGTVVEESLDSSYINPGDGEGADAYNYWIRHLPGADLGVYVITATQGDVVATSSYRLLPLAEGPHIWVEPSGHRSGDDHWNPFISPGETIELLFAGFEPDVEVDMFLYKTRLGVDDRRNFVNTPNSGAQRGALTLEGDLGLIILFQRLFPGPSREQETTSTGGA